MEKVGLKAIAVQVALFIVNLSIVGLRWFPACLFYPGISRNTFGEMEDKINISGTGFLRSQVEFRNPVSTGTWESKQNGRKKPGFSGPSVPRYN